MDLQLAGRRAIVTGGSRGIGRAVAQSLVSEGVDTAVVGRTPEALEQTVEELSVPSEAQVIAAPADTGDTDQVEAMVADVIGRLGGVDILVNAAAVPGGGPVPSLGEITDELFWEDMNVKVMGYLRCARAVAPHMQAAGWGRIINIGGLAARRTNTLVGSMRNVAVASLSKNLADQFGPDGINVTVVHPGLTWTERMPELISAKAARSSRTEEEVLAEFAGANSIGRLVTAAEVADVVTFLASPRSVAINGDAVAVGGGGRGSIYY